MLYTTGNYGICILYYCYISYIKVLYSTSENVYIPLVIMVYEYYIHLEKCDIPLVNMVYAYYVIVIYCTYKCCIPLINLIYTINKISIFH
jgi:hypothetical protein